MMFKGIGFSISLIILFFICLFLLRITENLESNENSVSDIITVKLFYNSPCESCHENKKFDEAVREKINETDREINISSISYNVFREKDRVYMERQLKDLGLSIASVQLPFALIDGEIYQGNYEEIGNRIKDNLDAGIDVKSVILKADSTDSVILFFTTYSCESCAEVKNYIKSSVRKEYKVAKGQVETISKVKVIECNILIPENLELLKQLMELYAVHNEEQRVPIIFYKEGYLSGEADIKVRLQSIVERGSAMGFQLKEVEEEGTVGNAQESDLWKIAITGFLNGLNPCAASMLLMVLSILLMTNNNFLKGSFSYMSGKIIAYMGMGMGAFWIFTRIEESYFTWLKQAVIICFSVLAFVLSILNFVDFWNSKKKNYGKVIVQLPKKLRHFNHAMIKRIKKMPAVYLVPGLFVLGMVISAGEFFCTGQLYAASILYMAKQKPEMTSQVFWLLLVYVLAMCLPQGIMILIINRSRSLFAISRLNLQGMPVIKLVYGFVFLLLFILLLFF